MKKIFVINPGSTSTKIAVYEDEQQVWVKNIRHSTEELLPFHKTSEQYNYRRDCIEKALFDAHIDTDFDAVVGRGGLIKPCKGGVYEVNDKMKRDLKESEMDHACNLGALLADEWAHKVGCRAYTADPVVVDEMEEKARITGLPGLKRKSIFHALNSKAVARRYAVSINKRYEDLDLIVVHLGGGISIGAHRHGLVIDVNNALNGDGPFAPERTGSLPSSQFAQLCFSGRYTMQEIGKMLAGKGGIVAHIGVNDMLVVEQRAKSGDNSCKMLIEAMMYNVAKYIGAMHVALKGKTQAILLTGGIAFSDYCVNILRKQIEFIAPVKVFPGEDEMGALAGNAFRALNGTQQCQVYTGCL